MPSGSSICCSRAAISPTGSRLRLNCRQRDSTVDRQLLRIGGGQQELHVRRRLLQRLEQRVEGMRREHVHLVDEVHLVAALGRRVLHVVQQLARIVDAWCARPRRLRSDPRTAPASISRQLGALPAGRGRNPALAIEALGEDARDGGLAHAARAGEQEGVMDAPASSALRRAPGSTCSCPTMSAKVPGPPLASQRDIAHSSPLPKSKWR